MASASLWDQSRHRRRQDNHWLGKELGPFGRIPQRCPRFVLDGRRIDGSWCDDPPLSIGAGQIDARRG